MKQLKKIYRENGMNSDASVRLGKEETKHILGGFADASDAYSSCSGLIIGGCQPGCRAGCIPGNK